MSWKRVTFSDKEREEYLHLQMESQFKTWYLKSAGPWGAAMFTSRQQRGMVYYFSPATETWPFLDRYGAEDCPAPKRSEVELITGDENLNAMEFASEG